MTGVATLRFGAARGTWGRHGSGSDVGLVDRARVSGMWWWRGGIAADARGLAGSRAPGWLGGGSA
jgi:hypothetical protein